MPDPIVSVIIPAYNAEHTLEACLKSVFWQTYSNTEVIVVDDGSEDDTRYIAQSFEKKIIYIEQKNAGQGAARNCGLEHASGDYVAFLDADDYWKKDFLNSCVTFLENHPKAVAVSTGLIIRMGNGKEIIHSASLPPKSSKSDSFMIENFYEFWARHDHVRTGSVLIKMETVREAGGQRADLRISQDLEYWGYISTFGNWGYIPEPLWVGNSHAGARKNWHAHYQRRRAMCPSVEAWQDRILPRLTSTDMHHFHIVRGRVACGYANNKILAGEDADALHIVSKYGVQMPRNRLASFLRIGVGPVGILWRPVCEIIRFKEKIKACFLKFCA